MEENHINEDQRNQRNQSLINDDRINEEGNRINDLLENDEDQRNPRNPSPENQRNPRNPENPINDDLLVDENLINEDQRNPRNQRNPSPENRRNPRNLDDLDLKHSKSTDIPLTENEETQERMHLDDHSKLV